MFHTWFNRLQKVSNLPKMYISENSKGFLLGSSAMRFFVRWKQFWYSWFNLRQALSFSIKGCLGWSHTRFIPRSVKKFLHAVTIWFVTCKEEWILIWPNRLKNNEWIAQIALINVIDSSRTVQQDPKNNKTKQKWCSRGTTFFSMLGVFESASKTCSAKSNENCTENRSGARVTRHQLSARQCCAGNRRYKSSRVNMPNADDTRWSRWK